MMDLAYKKSSGSGYSNVSRDSRDVGGVGLGLSIVLEVVTAYEGSVRVEDNLPGARFTIRLPAAT
jgi:signal transduction histidine kinase